jgi:hypothetical protein
MPVSGHAVFEALSRPLTKFLCDWELFLRPSLKHCEGRNGTQPAHLPERAKQPGLPKPGEALTPVFSPFGTGVFFKSSLSLCHLKPTGNHLARRFHTVP